MKQILNLRTILVTFVFLFEQFIFDYLRRDEQLFQQDLIKLHIDINLPRDHKQHHLYHVSPLLHTFKINLSNSENRVGIN